MFTIVENEPLAPHSTFRVGGIACALAICTTESDIPLVVDYANARHLPIRSIGSGSNTIFSDKVLPYCFVQLTTRTRQTLKQHNQCVYISFDAGLLWDEAVQWTVKNQYAGIEALSGIPGTCGAAPVQNIGAYGQELCQVVKEICVYDITIRQFVSLPASLCAFGYRTSIFKTTHKDRYIIVSIVIKLSHGTPALPNYPDVKDYFVKKNIAKPSHADIRHAILEIRNHKLPNPDTTPNVGSFFKNPIITKTHAESLRITFPDIKIFPVSDTQVKIPAGWLIERAGLKGSSIGRIGVYEKNALVLINHGDATYSDVLHTKNEIEKQVQKLFDIKLEIEPEIVT